MTSPPLPPASPPQLRTSTSSPTSTTVTTPTAPTLPSKPRTQPTLPPELIAHTIDQLIPSPSTIALPAHHPTTKLLLTLTLVSRQTYIQATRLLYRHCLYIDTSTRLRLLLICLVDRHRILSSPPPSNPPENASVNVSSCLQNLYLSPFPAHSIDDLPTAQWVFELCSLTRHTMRRVVWDIDRLLLPPERDHLSVLPKLVAGLRVWVDEGRRGGDEGGGVQIEILGGRGLWF